MYKIILSVVATLCMALISTATIAEDSIVYELRTYTTNEGKLADLPTRRPR
ncbi:MAG: hypothetical protein ACI9FB_002793 [Candidatus Azotimanducaceae bacterium]|jgi:hypothetical protein